MSSQSEPRHTRLRLALIGLMGALVALSFVLLARGVSRGGQATGPSPTSIWEGLLERTPITYMTPRPDRVETPIDGIYAKLSESWPQWWLCRRCADYRPAGGVWRLQFDRGVMRIYYEVTGWRSLASYSVAEDRLYLFNDDYCPNVGVYAWRVVEGSLDLDVIEDGCLFQLRGENLAEQVWAACLPASRDIGIAVGQDTHPGCPESPRPEVETPRPSTAFQARVYPGDSHYFETPPDLFALANPGRITQPDGIRVTSSPTSIPYGVNRVLWWNGPWIEARTDRPFAAMGVQFLGGPQIGWATVLLDGEEVWRGITGEIGSLADRFGGYVEVSGYGPGPHTLRVESLGSDYRPVEVFGFGFSFRTGVSPSP